MSRVSKRLFSGILAAAVFFIFALPSEASQSTPPYEDSAAYQSVHEAYVKSKTPGITGFVSRPDSSTPLAMGVMSLESGVPVEAGSPTQLFQLASVSKAFTALGVLLLEEEGMLALEDPVSDYLPWFSVTYKGAEQPITIANLLYHTSGLTNGKHFVLLPEGEGEGALRYTVECFSGAELAFQPGERMEYGTMNYDVLGYLLQELSGLSYEDFMRQRIFEPLGLYHTYAGVTDAARNAELAAGYKVAFLSPRLYRAPVYQGNNAAGYICSSAEDMERWAHMQLGTIQAPTPFDRLIVQSHIPDTSVPPVDSSYYAAGWFVSEDGRYIEHSGGNPNFTTHLRLLPKESSAICVLTNATSINMDGLIDNLTGLLDGEPPQPYSMGGLQVVDIAVSALSLLLLCLTILMLVLAARHLRRGRRESPMIWRSRSVVILCVCFLLALFLSWTAPRLAGQSWGLINVWTPVSVLVVVIMLCVTLAAALVLAVTRSLSNPVKK